MYIVHSLLNSSNRKIGRGRRVREPEWVVYWYFRCFLLLLPPTCTVRSIPMRAVMRRMVLPNSLLVRLSQQGVCGMCVEGCTSSYILLLLFNFHLYFLLLLFPIQCCRATEAHIRHSWRGQTSFQRTSQRNGEFCVLCTHVSVPDCTVVCVCVCVCAFGIQNLASTTTWDQAMKQIINDPRYMYVAAPKDPPT